MYYVYIIKFILITIYCSGLSFSYPPLLSFSFVTILIYLLNFCTIGLESKLMHCALIATTMYGLESDELNPPGSERHLAGERFQSIDLANICPE